MTFLPMGAHYLIDMCRPNTKLESKNETQIENQSESALTYHAAYPNLPSLSTGDIEHVRD